MTRKTMMFLAAMMVSSGLWAAGNVLDGTTWNLTLTPKADATATATTETLQFKDGQIITTANGLASVPYKLTDTDDKVPSHLWIAMQSDNAGHKAEWRGTVKQDTMNGIFIATDPSGKKQRFNFQGTIKK